MSREELRPGETPSHPERLLSHVADVALFGSMRWVRSGGIDWMQLMEKKLQDRGINVFNPNRGTGKSTETPEERQEAVARESAHMLESKVLVMNFESGLGAISPSELRIALLSAALSGQVLFVNIERTNPEGKSEDEVRRLERNRMILQADVAYFSEAFKMQDRVFLKKPSDYPRFANGKTNPAYNNTFDETTAEQIAELIKRHKNEWIDMKELTKQRPMRPLQDGQQQNQFGVTISGTGSTQEDMKQRAQIIEQLKSAEYTVADTHVEGYSDHLPLSRFEELEMMRRSERNLCYIGKSSLTKYGQIATALLMSALTGSRTFAYVDPKFKEKLDNSYETTTLESHIALLNEKYGISYTTIDDLSTIQDVLRRP